MTLEMQIGPQTDPLETIRAALTTVDGYQPVYKFEGELRGRPVSRTCLDRCEFLENELAPDIRNLRILDVGCSMGYLSLYFAERGATVTGIDFLPQNVEFCNTLSQLIGVKVDFLRAEFSEAFCHSVIEGQYDIVFLFSVLHHVTQRYGIAAVNRMMMQLLDKCDVLYVELARKSENVSFEWRKVLPENDLDIFAGIHDLEISHLGDYPALNGTVSRPLYRVRKVAKIFNGIVHKPMIITRSEIKSGVTKHKKYAASDILFSKFFIFSRREHYLHFAAEVDATRRIGPNRHFLPMIGSELRGAMGVITRPRLFGKSLMAAIKDRDPLEVQVIAKAIVEILRAFANAGLYWNDFRSHNIMVSDRGVYAIDFEVAAPVEMENTLNLFLWLLYDIQSGVLQTQRHQALNQGGLLKVPRPPLKIGEYADSVRGLAEIALASTNIREFLSRVS